MNSVLFLTPQLPYPPKSGGVIVSNKLLEHLNQNYDLTVACLVKPGDEQYIVEFEEKYNLSKKLISEKQYKEKSIQNLALSFLNRIPLSVYRNKNNSLLGRIRTVIDNYDTVIVDHFLMFQYIPKDYKGKILFHTHNAEFVMWRRFATQENNLLKKFLIRFESFRIRRYENKIIQYSSKVFCIASNDISAYKKISKSHSKISLLAPPGDILLLSQPNIDFNKAENALLFIGTLSWNANSDGLIWFIKSCWSNLKTKIPTLKLYIVGAGPNEELMQLSMKNQDIVITGFVEDLEEYYIKSKVFISPLNYGSGIKIKNLNAMYRGLPLVTTDVGIEGIPGKDHKNCLIANTAEEFIQSIEETINSPSLAQMLAKNARELFLNQTDKENSYSELDNYILNEN